MSKRKKRQKFEEMARDIGFLPVSVLASAGPIRSEAKTSLPPLCEECWEGENPEYRIEIDYSPIGGDVTRDLEKLLVCFGCACGIDDAGLLVRATRVVRV